MDPRSYWRPLAIVHKVWKLREHCLYRMKKCQCTWKNCNVAKSIHPKSHPSIIFYFVFFLCLCCLFVYARSYYKLSKSNTNVNFIFRPSESTATVSLSELRLPLMWKDLDHFKNRGDYRRFAVFCMARIGTEICDTSLLCPIDRTHTDITFVDPLILWVTLIELLYRLLRIVIHILWSSSYIIPLQ